MPAERPRAAVYVDGFNLYHRALRNTPYKWLDLGKLCTFLLPEYEIARIRYFTAMVDPRPDDPQQQQRQQIYIRALTTIPNMTVTYGLFKTRRVWLPRANRKPGEERFIEVLRTDEKGSDVNLATALLADGFRDEYDVAVVVSNDSDLVRPIQVVREELKKVVGVVITDAKTVKSALPADFHKRISAGVLTSCQFKDTVRDEKGPIRKPAKWR
jgi:uncharacterized LabA/DUF88 family protein